MATTIRPIINNSIGIEPPSKQHVKRIVSTMESVINSVTKIHRNKRKKRSKLDEPEISNISNILNNSLSLISSNVSQEDKIVESKSSLNDISKLPLNWKNHLLSNSINCLDSKENTPIRPINVEKLSLEIINENSIDSTMALTPTSNNAFEIMMKARSKCIGTNSPGKDTTVDEEICLVNTVKAKRKLMLEEWANKKGGLKRKLEEEASEKYVQKQMSKRAKRLKQLISNGEKRTKRRSNVSQQSTTSINGGEDESIIEIDENVKDKNKKKLLKKNTKKVSKNLRDKSNNQIVEANTLQKTLKEDQENSIISIEDDEFISRLSSPIKKRDSLLAYFDTIEQCTTSKKSKSSNKKQNKQLESLISINHQLLLSNDDREKTPPSQNLSNRRPKRQCCMKPMIVYSSSPDHKSPDKVAANKILKRVRRHLTGSKETINQSPPKIQASIVKKNKNHTETTKAGKLASIFMKKSIVPKPFVDPLKLKARKNFLMSGIPTCMKIEIDKQRVYTECYEQKRQYFPAVSHVRQLNKSDRMIDEVFKFNFRPNTSTLYNDDHKYEQFICGQKTPTISTKFKHINVEYSPFDRRNMIKLIKQRDNSTFPFYRCFKQLRVKHTNDICLEITENNVIETFDQSSKNGQKMFSEKYKPLKYDEFIVNHEPILRLKDFLIGWESINQNNQKLCKNVDSSGDEFDIIGGSSCSNSAFSTAIQRNAIVLYGPHGCGKTNAVYAVANDMNFNVLEMNAGCRRTGKKILKKLQEATQSHQVKNNNNSNKCDAIFVPALNGKQQTLTKQLNEFGGDSTTQPSTSSGDDSQTMSLILIEDADIYFDEDIGYVDGINQLISTSKRPVILMSNRKDTFHLNRFIKQTAIEFLPADSADIAKWLTTLSIIERCYIPAIECQDLYEINKKDLRSTLLQFQFYIQSGGNSDCPRTEKNHNYNDKTLESLANSVHVGLINVFHKNVINPFGFKFLQIQIQSNDKTNKKYDNRYLKNISEIFYTIDCVNYKSKNVDFQSSLGEDIADEITHLSTKIWPTENANFTTTKISDNLKSLLTATLTLESRQRVLSLDYQPTIRSICRMENSRKITERRGRSNRFYHYLRNIGKFDEFTEERRTHDYHQFSNIFQSDN